MASMPTWYVAGFETVKGLRVWLLSVAQPARHAHEGAVARRPGAVAAGAAPAPRQVRLVAVRPGCTHRTQPGAVTGLDHGLAMATPAVRWRHPGGVMARWLTCSSGGWMPLPTVAQSLKPAMANKPDGSDDDGHGQLRRADSKLVGGGLP
jgi:hypothetical protein